mgnify:FL=1
MAIVDKHGAIHICTADNEKDAFPCDSLLEGEEITSITEYKKGLLVSGNKASLIFFYPVDGWCSLSFAFV